MADEIQSEKKENVIVINKSKLIIAIIVLIIIGIWVFFFYNKGGGNYIASDSPILGNSDATIYVVEFSDYECPYCQASEGTNQEIIDKLKQRDPSWEAPIPNIIDEYVDTGKVKLVFRQYPSPLHAHSEDAALAAKCAQEQGKFWEYHKKLFENYYALTTTNLKKYAADLDLNLNQFNQCMDSKKYEESVKNDLSDGNDLKVEGTPTFFIGNEERGYEKVVGSQSFSAFKQIIESKL